MSASAESLAGLLQHCGLSRARVVQAAADQALQLIHLSNPSLSAAQLALEQLSLLAALISPTTNSNVASEADAAALSSVAALVHRLPVMLCLFSSFANAQQTREAEAAAEAFAVAVHNAFPSSQASQAVHEEIAASLEAHAKEETWPEEEDDDELEAHMSAAAHERKRTLSPALACRMLAHVCRGSPDSLQAKQKTGLLLALLPHTCTHKRMPVLAALADALRVLLEPAQAADQLRHEVLLRAWDALNGPRLQQPRQFPGALALLCALGDLFFDGAPAAQAHPRRDLREDTALWELLLRALADDDDALSRKRAGHVMRSAVQPLTARSRHLCAEPFFHWDPTRAAELRESYTDIVVLSEMVDEKQVHIVLPAMARLRRLYPHVDSPAARPRVHYAWLAPLFHRFGSHSRANIRTLGMLAACCIRFPDQAAAANALHDHPFLTRGMLAALNTAGLFAVAASTPEGCAPALGTSAAAFYTHLLTVLAPEDRVSAHRRLLAGLRAYVNLDLPLTFLLHALTEAPPCPAAYDATAVEDLTAIAHAGRRTQELPLRSTVGLLVLRVLRRHLGAGAAAPGTGGVGLQALGDCLSACALGEAWMPGDAVWRTTGAWMCGTALRPTGVQGLGAVATALAAEVTAYLDEGLAPDAALTAPARTTERVARLVALALPWPSTAGVESGGGVDERAAKALIGDPTEAAPAGTLSPEEVRMVLEPLQLALAKLHTHTHTPLPRRVRALALLDCLGQEVGCGPSIIQRLLGTSGGVKNDVVPWLAAISEAAAEGVAAFVSRCLLSPQPEETLAQANITKLYVDALFLLLQQPLPQPKASGVVDRLEKEGREMLRGSGLVKAVGVACLACLPALAAPLPVLEALMAADLTRQGLACASQAGEGTAEGHGRIRWSSVLRHVETQRWRVCKQALLQLKEQESKHGPANGASASLESSLTAVVCAAHEVMERGGQIDEQAVGCVRLALELGLQCTDELGQLFTTAFALLCSKESITQTSTRFIADSIAVCSMSFSRAALLLAASHPSLRARLDDCLDRLRAVDALSEHYPRQGLLTPAVMAFARACGAPGVPDEIGASCLAANADMWLWFLTYGPQQTPDMRARHAVVSYWQRLGFCNLPFSTGLASPVDARLVRAQATALLNALRSDGGPAQMQAAQALFAALKAELERVNKISARNTAKMNEKLKHHKFRLAQTLLVAQGLIVADPDTAREAAELVWHELTLDQQMASRYLWEWALILSLRREWNQMLGTSDQAPALRKPGGPLHAELWERLAVKDLLPADACTRLTIVAKLAVKVDPATDAGQAFLQTAAERALAMLSHPHVSVRLYSVVTLVVVHQRLEMCHMGAGHYDTWCGRAVCQLLEGIDENNASRRYRDGLLDDFMFGRFDEERELTLTFLYERAPLLYGLRRIESIPATLLKAGGRIAVPWTLADTADEPRSTGKRTRSELRGANFGDESADDVNVEDSLPSELLEASPLPAGLAAASQAVRERGGEAEEKESGNEPGDLQKKIMTADTFAAGHELAFGEDSGALTRQTDTRGRSQLALVASLINLPTNLGGLCRTSEIFNLERLVLPEEKWVHHKDFKSLSVKSEKWVDFEFVTPSELAEWLRGQRAAGYTLVGLEQTMRSVSLEKFDFPEKTVLVLGEEKRGIPANIIHLLDFCLEIPQFGVTRSLNVHVSASIAIWSYVRQLQCKHVAP